jgi:PhzF family phenazine biosynthesis protein
MSSHAVHRTVQFKQVDVFTSVPFKGNPLAVIFDADGLSTERMQEIARWTNLSETVFLLSPTDARADYRVRIFTTAVELPFAGHPTLGSAHALIDAGYTPKSPGRLVQECGVGLVTLAERAGGEWAFAAPPARIAPLSAPQTGRLAAALGSVALDPAAPPAAVDNGAPWLVVRVRDAAQCLALNLQGESRDTVRQLVAETGTHGLVVYGPHASGGPATFELRALLLGAENIEDPVTGSANAALATLLTSQGLRPGPQYTVRQGTAIGRDGRVSVTYDDLADGAPVWIGGHSVTVIDGNFRS